MKKTTCNKCGSSDLYDRGGCKPCLKTKYVENRAKLLEYQKEYQKQNLDKRKITNARYAKNNKEKVAAYQRLWASKNKDKVRIYNLRKRAGNYAYMKAWRLKNSESLKKYYAEYNKSRVEDKELVKIRLKRWHDKNPLARKIYSQNRRSKIQGDGGTLSKGLIDKLLKLQKGLCACCKKKLGNKYHVDHIMPLHLGGRNSDENIQLLTPRCNLQKHAKHPIDFMQERGFLL